MKPMNQKSSKSFVSSFRILSLKSLGILTSQSLTSLKQRSSSVANLHIAGQSYPLMKKPSSTFLAALVALSAIGMTAASAQTIISDDFANVTNGDPIDGREPDLKDLPGSTYSDIDDSLYGNTSAGDPAPDVTGKQGLSNEEISLSGGLYVPPSTFTVSLDLSPQDIGSGGNISVDASPVYANGVGLGFFTSNPNVFGPGEGFGASGFTGLVLDSSGDLSFVSELPTSLAHLGLTGSSQIAYQGATAFNPDDFYKLSYTVDTITGDISDISLSGSTADYSSLETASDGLFTKVNTASVGLYGIGESGGDYGSYDNLLVAGTPEPGTCALMLGSLGALLAFARLRRHSA
jgi:hypothetical protein